MEVKIKILIPALQSLPTLEIFFYPPQPKSSFPKKLKASATSRNNSATARNDSATVRNHSATVRNGFASVRNASAMYRNGKSTLRFHFGN